MAKHEELVKKLIDTLYKRKSGSKTSISKLLIKCGYDPADYEKSGELFAIYDEFCKEAKKQKITLDWSEHEGKDVGLPYNLPFVATWEEISVCGGIQPEKMEQIKQAIENAEGTVEITLERSHGKTVKVTVSYDDDVAEIGDEDLDILTLDELRDKLDEAESALDDLEGEEPDGEDDEAYAVWEAKHCELEDLVDEIEDKISELEDAEDEEDDTN